MLQTCFIFQTFLLYHTDLEIYIFIILGPYGINHGVEIHADVVEYAQERLRDFRAHSPALDEYEFCEPKFVQGNKTTRLY